jgi:hypothetical protein
MATIVSNGYASVSETKDGSIVTITAQPSYKAWLVVYGKSSLPL